MKIKSTLLSYVTAFEQIFLEDTMSQPSEPDPIPILPDPEICRAAELTEHFAECLVERPSVCQFAMPFGYKFLCGHPEQQAIITRARQTPNPKIATD